MEGNEMFLLLFVFVCQGVLGGQMKFFCVFGWGMVGRCGLFRGGDGFLGLFWGLGLAGWQFETRGCG